MARTRLSVCVHAPTFLLLDLQAAHHSVQPRSAQPQPSRSHCRQPTACGTACPSLPHVLSAVDADKITLCKPETSKESRQRREGKSERERARRDDQRCLERPIDTIRFESQEHGGIFASVSQGGGRTRARARAQTQKGMCCFLNSDLAGKGMTWGGCDWIRPMAYTHRTAPPRSVAAVRCAGGKEHTHRRISAWQALPTSWTLAGARGPCRWSTCGPAARRCSSWPFRTRCLSLRCGAS